MSISGFPTYFVRIGPFCGVWWLLHGLAVAAAPREQDFFETRIRPLLAENCFECHGEKKQKAGLRVDNIGYLLQGGDEGPGLLPGDALASLLYRKVTSADEDERMPPEGQLTEQQIADLRRWIDAGARWPADEAIIPRAKGDFTAEDRAWWAFHPLAKITPPEIAPAGARVNGAIDRFIVERLQQAGLSQAPPASPQELVRRLYYNLHGLPPTAGQMEKFLNDRRPDAYERLVDELLDSPRYGMRWAQHWLDLVRFAETDGYREDAFRPRAWTYRDYVIRSLNDDKPYDRFVREQLAADELYPGDPEAMAGTGFLRHGIYEWNQRDAETQRSLMVNEVTDVTAEVFLGLSMACARCHDHKFDPILQKDYYRLHAFFEPMLWREDLPHATADEIEDHQRQMAEWEMASRDARAAVDALLEPARLEARTKAIEIFPENVQEMVYRPDDRKSPYDKLITDLVQRQVVRDVAKAEESVRKKGGAEFEALKALEATKPAPLPAAFVTTDVSATAPPTVMTTRRGEIEVQPGFLTLLDPADARIEPLHLLNSTGRRSALAQWIASPDNPLSTRVIVNRVWQHHFGRGISTTTSDFGRLGEPPTHPDLLDWLTAGFIENRWSLKWLHRQILTSATYRQSSIAGSADPAGTTADPNNQLLWKMNPQRLDAEQARDTLLYLSGELRDVDGGPSAEPARAHRSIFTQKRRNSQEEFLSRFDAAAGFHSVSKRDSTTTPLQSLLMINGDWPLQRSRHMASRLLEAGNDNPAQLAASALELVFSRKPTRAEISSATYFLTRQEKLIEGELPPPAPPEDPVVPSGEKFHHSPLAGSHSLNLVPATPYEKALAALPRVEEENFTIEAVLHVGSLASDASVRTIASRWNGDQSQRGWALGLTGKKSGHGPGNLIVQLVGDDFQGAITYEVVVSGIRLAEKTAYHVAASVSGAPMEGQPNGGSVTFHATALDPQATASESRTIPHGMVRAWIDPERKLVLGGRENQQGHQWHGLLARVVLSDGILEKSALLPDAAEPGAGAIADLTPAALGESLSWINDGKPVTQADENPARLEALTDLVHALINSNEFLYLP